MLACTFGTNKCLSRHLSHVGIKQVTRNAIPEQPHNAMPEKYAMCMSTRPLGLSATCMSPTAMHIHYAEGYASIRVQALMPHRFKKGQHNFENVLLHNLHERFCKCKSTILPNVDIGT